MRDPLRKPTGRFEPEREQVLENILKVISSASASLLGFEDNELLTEDLDTSEQFWPYLYRIAGAFTLATSILERYCYETGQRPIEVLRDLGLRVSQTLTLVQAQHPPEDEPPGLEPV